MLSKSLPVFPAVTTSSGLRVSPSHFIVGELAQLTLHLLVIALHVAYSPGGAQFYTSCFPITVSGGGSTLPSHTVKFPGAYSSTDPGILYDLYDGYTSYPIPGPPVWACSFVGEPTTVSPQPTAVPSPSSTLSSTPPASTTSEAAL